MFIFLIKIRYGNFEISFLKVLKLRFVFNTCTLLKSLITAMSPMLTYNCFAHKRILFKFDYIVFFFSFITTGILIVSNKVLEMLSYIKDNKMSRLFGNDGELENSM